MNGSPIYDRDLVSKETVCCVGGKVNNCFGCVLSGECQQSINLLVGT